MKKLKLNLEDLKVESFEINNSKNMKGTVNGNLPPQCDDNSGGGGGGGGSLTGGCTCLGNSCGYSRCPEMCVSQYTDCGSCPTECGYPCV